jgi:hypothetical protein
VRLKLATSWRRLDRSGLDDLRDWCKSVTKPVLIVIDVLKKLRKPKQRAQSDYDADYEAFEELIKLAHEFPGLTIMAAHHDRKMEAEDVFDTASGTLGLTGGVDTIALLKRNKQGVTLHIRGRDLEDDVEKAVSFDRETCRWTILGEAAEVQRSVQRERVKAALKGEPDGLGVTEIVGRAQLLKRNAADLLLGKMAADGEIERIKRGIYGMRGTRSKLSAERSGQKDRKKGKLLNSQDDNHLSVDLSHHSTQTDIAPMRGPAPSADLEDPITPETTTPGQPVAFSKSQSPLRHIDCGSVVSTPSSGRCAQCNGELADAPFCPSEGVHLHPECRRFWLAHHPGDPSASSPDIHRRGRI